MLSSKSTNKDFIISPKPYVPNKNGFSQVKPPEVAESPVSEKINIPQISNADLSKARLKKTNLLSSTTDNQNIPEFLRHELKSPAQRKAEAELNKKPERTNKPLKPLRPINQKPVSEKPEILTKKPSFTFKPDNVNNDDINQDISAKKLPSMNPKVTSPPLVVSNVDRSDSNNNVETSKEDDSERRNIRAGSVLSGKLMFENMKNNTFTTADKIKEPIKLFDEETMDKNKIDISQKNNSEKVGTEHVQVEDGDEIYNDVITLSNDDAINENTKPDELLYEVDLCTNQNEGDNLNHQVNQDCCEEDFYNDVETVHENIINPGINQSASKSNSTSDTMPLNTLLDQNDVLEEESFYNDVDEQSSTSSIPQSIMNTEPVKKTIPQKPPRSFQRVNAEQFLTPYGLDSWLKDILNINKERLKKLNITCEQSASDNCQNEIIEENTYYPKDDNDRLDILNPKERKKFNTLKKNKDKNREKLEKKEREEKEKQEKIKRKKKEKCYKKFNLNINMDFTFTGTLICKENFKSQNKMDLSYEVGDEISIVEVKKCPKDKLLALHSSHNILGYILKKDFGIADSPDVAEGRRTPSPIPTEDDIGGEDYDSPIEFYGEITVPPPIPETPRPQLLSSDSVPPSIPSTPRPVPNTDFPSPHPQRNIPPRSFFMNEGATVNSPVADDIYDDVDNEISPQDEDGGDIYDDVEADLVEDQIYDVAN